MKGTWQTRADPLADAIRRVRRDPDDRAARLEAGVWSDRFFSRRALLKRFEDLANMPTAEEQALAAFELFTGCEPHGKQLEFFLDQHRFSTAVAGVQSGKTTIGASRFWKKIISEDKPGALYWMIAPDSNVGRTMRERFNAQAPDGWIVKPAIPGLMTFTWYLKNGARVEFRSGERPERLVAASVDGVWIDEFTKCKPKVWSAGVRQRLAATGGWGQFTGTPEGRNWAWEEIWRPSVEGDDRHDPLYAGFTWHSKENPRVSDEDIESARRTLPPAYFRREYEASWDAFHGQVYESFDQEIHVEDDLIVPAKLYGETFFGQDFGFAKPGCTLVCHKDRRGQWYILDEIHEQGQMPDWWRHEVALKALKWKPRRVWCDSAEPAEIRGLRAVEVDVSGRGQTTTVRMDARGAPKDIRAGIKEIAKLFALGYIRIHSRCRNLVRELAGYRWAEDSQGNRREMPIKENDHACDALRYCIMGETNQKGVAATSGSYGTT